MSHHASLQRARRMPFVTIGRLAAFAFLGSAALIVPANATPPSGFVGTVQWEGRFGDLRLQPKTDTFDLKLQTKGDFDLVVTKINIAAGGTSGWHTHPGSSLVTVTSGTISLYDAALCTARQVGVGQTFVDEGGDHLHLVRNETSSTAQVSVVQMVERNVLRRIDAPRPNNCEPDVQ